MNSVDASEHYELGAPVIDTNPHAWAVLEDSLPLSKAIANILVFINAHLACNYANEVAVVASHSQKAAWLYPSHSEPRYRPADHDGDVTMNGTSDTTTPKTNKYRPFRIVEEQVTRNLKELMDSTTGDDLRGNMSTMLAGALTLALSHINRRTLAWAEEHGGANTEDAAADGNGGGTTSTNRYSASNEDERLQSRILVVSVSGSTDAAHQYIPVMNSIFACQRLSIPIDVCLLQYLMMAFLPDQRSRRHLVLPTRVDVDFRAACFCHRRVVDVGFVCSICLSIFCEPPPGGDCMTCGSHLDIRDNAKPALLPRKKKKKKRVNGASGAGTPMSTPTPGP
ncbi:hypothetical protein N7519_005803 [Penicillium mononematosum]|uniref:uncharacterized protein n=1 Tax=Penicillium mononematosum TaxID=268346 RepID=UPI0025489FCA|nr:uncharacterized protein N7519_005803 [Penicillium mononematosum]KAJ6184502.1 hypothetical protein N7519_005803 [Penicillium mononematosum]